MPGASVVEGMCELFRGRLDAYGTDEGGCDKIDTSKWGIGQEVGPMAEFKRRMAQHLVGDNPFGVYPLVSSKLVVQADAYDASLGGKIVSGGEVRWGCTDLDNVTSPAAAKNIARTLQALGLNAWVELSRSKGFHVWSFSYEWVPAETMRYAFLAVHQLLGIPATEVNPKQTTLASGQFGNYVRIPYPGVLSGAPEDNLRQAVYDLDTSKVLAVDTFIAQALAGRSSRLQYEKAASRYVVPPPRSSVAIGAVFDKLDTIVKRLNKPGYCAFQYGPQEGHDRSSSLARLAHNCRESGLTASEARVILLDADGRWGKFSERPDQEEQLTKMIERAYG